MQSFHFLLANALGARCVLCHQRLHLAQFGVCSRCYRALSQWAYCGRCGQILPRHEQHCGQCLHHPPRWHHLVHVSPFQPPLSGLIHQFKFQQGYALDRTLARLLLLAIKHHQRLYQTPMPDEIIPVPLHTRRHKRRGYNQAELLARQLAHYLQLPVNLRALERVYAVAPQRGLSARARRENVRHVFQATQRFDGKHIALVDDVVTTGATVNELCRVLKRAGAREVSIWCLCRSQRH
ncbi:amidophosphoribosyltransferase [Pasteurellaceae bacterium HPA106]|uniref:phosphoribosyltransferase family protein n=1 Tax=Spirabiliibacterium pneumoniae TaxID=221400 RepID=UPI001AAD3A1E|nr:phosphoribosyltransferase family protein [Spirabiliibacterium pneumoniae]MBE2896905.1 amidophosphoribosyltransferase [Spirabiliibacterium pneumoniae]